MFNLCVKYGKQRYYTTQRVTMANTTHCGKLDKGYVHLNHLLMRNYERVDDLLALSQSEKEICDRLQQLDAVHHHAEVMNLTAALNVVNQDRINLKRNLGSTDPPMLLHPSNAEERFQPGNPQHWVWYHALELPQLRSKLNTNIMSCCGRQQQLPCLSPDNDYHCFSAADVYLYLNICLRVKREYTSQTDNTGYTANQRTGWVGTFRRSSPVYQYRPVAPPDQLANIHL